MKNLDRITGIVLFLIGLGICLKSLTYTVGSLRSPHAGFFPLLNSFIMMGLSALMTVQTFLKKDTGEASKARFSPSEGASKRIIIGFMILVGFRYLARGNWFWTFYIYFHILPCQIHKPF